MGLTYATNALLICTCSALQKNCFYSEDTQYYSIFCFHFSKFKYNSRNAPLVVKTIACAAATETGASTCSPCSSGMYSSAQGISSRIDNVVSFYLYLRMAGATACLGIECEPGFVGFTGRCNEDKL
jgi:hypothetical protein